MSGFLQKLREQARAATYTETYVTVAGGREVMVENVTHVYECNEILARVRTRDGDIEVWGEGLKMSSFKENIVKISGKITSVEIIKKGGEKQND